MHKNISFLLYFLVFIFKSCFAQNSFQVDDFGAKADGIFDNTESINKCIAAAIKINNSKVVFGNGNYLCKGRLNIEFLNDHQLCIVGQPGTTIEFSNFDLDKGLFIRGNENKISVGTVRLENFKIVGPKLGNAAKNSYYNTVRHLYGIGISNIKDVFIDRLEIVNFYGNGIDVSNKLTRKQSSLYRFRNVEIKNCKILDTWGKSPEDSYGDAVYVADCNKFLISNNLINNNFELTLSLGRGGIVIEDYTSNGIIQGNKIIGYDRGIHIENTFGSINIINNSFKDNRIGIYLWSDGNNKAEVPIAIQSNRFWFENIIKRSDSLNFNDDKFMYIAILREKFLLGRDKLFNNNFILNNKIFDEKSAVNGAIFSKKDKNVFRR
ncbi:hypothetical protein [Sphingobacterium multivorum]|uniref:hypothetical protein n=1 Tax=Sphingobacterium multivorum TaxID=28454 RepID=UPI00345E9755